MDTFPAETYRGFDLYPLVYRTPAVQSWPRPKPERTFNASIVICRQGCEPGSDRSRVFRLEALPWDNVGTARRGALAFAQQIIDGSVPGESVATL